MITEPSCEEYAHTHTKPEPDLLQDLIKTTHENTNAPQMLTGRVEGRLLKMLVQLTGAKHILEVGMFTGYSALSMAEGLPDKGKIITCDVDDRVKLIAESFFAKSPHGHKVEIRMGKALETIASIDSPIDMAFIDADKSNYKAYYEAILEKLRPGGLIVLDNMLWSGRVVKPEDKQTKAIADTNAHIQADNRVENVLLTVRDGVHLVRKIA